MMLLLRDTLIKEDTQVYRVIKFYTMSLQCNMLEQFWGLFHDFSIMFSQNSGSPDRHKYYFMFLDYLDTRVKL